MAFRRRRSRGSRRRRMKRGRRFRGLKSPRLRIGYRM